MEEADKLLVFVILLREGEDQTPHRCQQLVRTHLVHVLLIPHQIEQEIVIISGFSFFDDWLFLGFTVVHSIEV